MTITEKFAVQNPMKWSAIENPISTSQVYVQSASLWLLMDEVERILDEDIPEEFRYVFENSSDDEILDTIIDVLSVLN